MTDAAVQRLMAALGSDQESAEPAVRRVRREIPSYAEVSHERLVASVNRNRAMALRALATGRVPPPEEIWEAELATLERLRAGLPIEDIMAAFRVSIASIQDRLVELASEVGVDSSQVVAMTTLLWRLSDAFASRAGATYRQEGVAHALADQRRRDEWFSGALGGTLSRTQLAHGCSAFGLNPAGTYRVLCAAPAGDVALERTMADLQGRRDRLLLTMPLNGHIVGLVKDSSVDSQHHLVAVGTPVPLERLAESHRIAERVLASARLQFEAGVHTLESLGWQFAVPLVTELSALLRDRYIAPLRATGDFGDQAIAAVRSYLAHECSIPRTAEALFVHVNTLRYRLARFEELTGRSLRSTDTLVELSLVLHEMHLRSQLRRRGQSVGVTSVVADVTRAISLRGAAGSTTTAPVTSSS